MEMVEFGLDVRGWMSLLVFISMEAMQGILVKGTDMSRGLKERAQIWTIVSRSFFTFSEG